MALEQTSNSYLEITKINTPDPWITQANNGKFYFTFTANNRIPMWEASSIHQLRVDPKRGPVWKAKQTGPQSERLWAPELHALRGRWYIYFAAADAQVGNRSHRMYVLGGPSADEDPHAGPWELLGPIRGMNQGQWAIDGTVFELDEVLYFCYSGWPRKENGEWVTHREDVQQLFILRLKDPVTADSEAVMICHPSQPWEQLPNGRAKICEGPQWLQSPSGHWKGIVYSCSASWTKHYKMATLQYLPISANAGPLDPRSWRKSIDPLLQNRPDGKGPFGPGHGCFLNLEDEGTVVFFHATDRETDGNRNRKCRMQRLKWIEGGPDMGGYVGDSAGTWGNRVEKIR
ncbi:hypothetical protein LTR37_004938 [Vermiconidia calcicola]|uniref:Uncharacterized protein n=1 Tax=Vermiconidia calcicola TaxID=1690605 RepID=A0ACC3NL35_9PEZI|nr:hypothetical protein LTR37_004938 [Vermiconidia calcicola]